MTKGELLQKSKKLPTQTGCYFMLNARGEVIYVGKAKNLRSRVTSYFNHSAKSVKTEYLVSHIDDIDFIITDDESEALIVENNLIKKHSPKYNIRLRDDKSYPYVVIDYFEPFPKIKYMRRPKKRREREIFGPYVEGSNISGVLRALRKSLQLRDCSVREFKSRKEPCLLYQINQCSAPCVDKISQEKYQADLQLAKDFLDGKPKKLEEQLEQNMFQAAEEELFERAAQIRDQIELLRDFQAKQSGQSWEGQVGNKNLDIVSFYQDKELDLVIYMIRDGKMMGHKDFNFIATDPEELEEAIQNYLFQYYRDLSETVPERIVVDMESEKRNSLGQALKKMGLEKVRVIAPQPGHRKIQSSSLSLAREKQKLRIDFGRSRYFALDQLRDLLKLKETPRLIECYDIAIWQGKSPTAAQIVFQLGHPLRSRYRHYSLKELPEGNNDFAMMKEVLTRRLKHDQWPDVFVVDGGRAQVNMFLQVLKEQDIPIPVIGLAKARKSSTGVKNKERLIIPHEDEPVLLEPSSAFGQMFIQMRDEAHRFSRRLHHKKEKGRIMGSWLDKIPGIGPKNKKVILQNLEHTKEELSLMEEEALSQTLGITPSLAARLKEYLSSGYE